MSDAVKSKAKKKWAIEKPKLDNARQMRGIFFIEPKDEEFKHTMKNARRKLEVRETEEGQQMQHLCRECTMPRNEKGLEKDDGFSSF